VHEVGREDDTIFIVSDFIDGLTLTDWLSARPLNHSDSAELCAVLADALHHAHEKGVIHRDLKPSNIMLDQEGKPHVMDFGLAKRDAGEITMTIQGQIIGTPAYMSPEQARGGGHGVDRRADAYSLGVILYELLTGERPFRGNTRMLIHQILSEDAPRPRKFNSTIPRDLETICLKCLRREPDRRYATCEELAADLRRWLEGKPINARPVSMFERTLLWARRRPGLVIGAASAAAVLTGILLLSNQVRREAEAARMVEALATAETPQTPGLVSNLRDYHCWAADDLNSLFTDSPSDSNAKLHAGLGLLPASEVIPFLTERLLQVAPRQFATVRNQLAPWADQLSAEYWPIARDQQQPEDRRFQAACALALFDGENEFWSDPPFQRFVASHLLEVLPSELQPWQSALQPVKQHLIEPLSETYRNDKAGEQRRAFATDTLANYLEGDTDALFDLLIDADGRQFEAIYAKTIQQRERAIELARAEVKRRHAGESTALHFVDSAPSPRRVANAAILLHRLESHAEVWPLLQHSPDPSSRSYLVNWLPERGAAPQPLIQRYSQETDPSAKRALLLCLGGWDPESIPLDVRQPFLDRLLRDYRSNADGGIHSAAEWVLRRWGAESELEEIAASLAQREADRANTPGLDSNWYINGQGQTYVVLQAGEFQMGNVGGNNTRRHNRRIDRRYAIAAREVTKANWRAFGKAASVQPADRAYLGPVLPTEDSPMTSITWHEAVWYCNWLSEQEGIPEDQWCYELGEKKSFYGRSVVVKENFLELAGYRLPTESEWSFACHAGATTRSYYGEADELAPQYAWSLPVSDNHAWPTAQLKPNDFGTFDMMGNALEWVHDLWGDFPDTPKESAPDAPATGPASSVEMRVMRGGCFTYVSGAVTSRHRATSQSLNRMTFVGFRPARTLVLTDE